MNNINGPGGEPTRNTVSATGRPNVTYPGKPGGVTRIDSYSFNGGRGGGGKTNNNEVWSVQTDPESGSNRVCIILRGNTNVPSPSQASALSLVPHNGEIEANWTNSGDPWQTGTMVVVNRERAPETPEDGEAVDVMQAESYTASGLENGKPCYIGLFAYNADKTKYSAVKADVEIPREVAWYDTQQELKQEVQEAEKEAQDATEQAEQAQEAIIMTRDFLPDVIALTVPHIYDEWNPNGILYTGKDKATEERPASIVGRNGKLYRCLQSHTSQENWKPEAAPSLWVEIADPTEEWPGWKQPSGAHDAYQKGEKVSHNGKHWISTAENNVWEPGVFGWDEVK